MGREKNKNGDGTIIDLWKKYGETRTKHKHKHYQCKIMCKELSDSGKKHFVYANHDDKEQARRICKQKATKFDIEQRQKRSFTFLDVQLDNKALFASSALVFMDYFAKERQWSGNTKLTRLSEMQSIIKRIGDYQIKNITVEVCKVLFANLIQEYTRQTVGSMYYLLTEYFNYLLDASVIAENPMLFVRLPKHKKAESLTMSQAIQGKKLKKNIDVLFTDTEINTLLNQAQGAMYTVDDWDEVSKAQLKQIRYNTYIKLIFAVIFLTGMRAGEMRALYVDDIDFKKSTVRINKALSQDTVDGKITMILKDTKTINSNRVIAVNSDTLEMLKAIKDLRPVQETPFLVQTMHGDWISKRYFITLFEKTLKQLHIDKNNRGIHCLRHTFISFAFEGNVLSPLQNQTPLFISKYVGHSSLDFTERIYTKISGNKISNKQAISNTTIEYF